MTFDAHVAGNSPVQTLQHFGPNWIIDTLPYLEEQPLHDAFDFSVDVNDPSPTSRNYIARGTVLSVLLCPSDSNNKVLYQGRAGSPHNGNWARTNYAANTGRAFIYTGHFTGPDSEAWLDSCRRGVMGPNVSVKLRQIIDGTSKTFLIGEILAGATEQDGRGVWAMGHAGASLVAMYGSMGDDNGPNFGDPNADDVYSDICGTNNELTAEEVTNNMPCFQGTVFDQATLRSAHVGGVFVAMCDSSVQFISDDVETSGLNGSCCTVWDRYITSGDEGAGGPYNGVRRGGCMQ